MHIMVGSNDLEDGIIHKVKFFVMHEDFDKPKYASDVAIVTPVIPIEFNTLVKPIAYSEEMIYEGTDLELTGWGRWTVIHLFI